jgi:hypothetical protein
VHLAVLHPEAALDGLSHSFQRPQICSEAGCLRPGQQDPAQLLVLLVVQLRRPPALVCHAQRLDAIGLQHVEPAIHGLPRRTDLQRHLRRRFAAQKQSRRTHPPLRPFVHRHAAHPHTRYQCASNA